MTCPGLSYDNALVLSQQDKNHSLPILRRRESRDIRVGSAATWGSSAMAAAKRSVSMRRRSGKYSMLFGEGWAG